MPPNTPTGSTAVDASPAAGHHAPAHLRLLSVVIPARDEEGCQPILSPHFNITVELPLKAIVRGYSWKVLPITWHNRRTGLAKLKIREMGSRYFFIVAYVWLEKSFSRGNYKRADFAHHT